MSLVLLAVLVVLGLLATAVMVVAQRRLLRAPAPVATDLPPVSILKPMRGADPGLEANLESFFVLDYPSYEVLLGGVCVVGKSMLLRAPVLRALGGFRFLADYLAEDQVCGEEVARLGLRTVVSGHLIDNHLGRVSVGGFLGRHLRWARIRRRMSPAGYLAELLLNPTFVALLGLALWPTLSTLTLFAGTAVVKGLLAVAAERVAGLRPRLAATLALSMLRDLLVGLTWAIPLVDCSVHWRGRRFSVGPRTLLSPSPAFAPEPLPAAEPLPDGAAAA